MDVMAWGTLIALGLIVRVILFPKKPRGMPPRAVVRGYAPSRRQKGVTLPEVARALSGALATTRLTVAEMWQAACMEWDRRTNPPPPRRPLLSTRPVMATPTPEIAAFPPVLALELGTELGNGTELAAGTEHNLPLRMPKTKVDAILKWKSGAPLNQSDVAALLGGRKADAMAAIVEVTRVEE